MDDLLDRVARAGVLVSGDINNSSPDRAFTGGDAFFVVLTAEVELHHYQVSAYGEVFYAGEPPLPPHHWDDQPPYPEYEQASHHPAGPADQEALPTVVLSRWRRVWAWLLQADEWLSRQHNIGRGRWRHLSIVAVRGVGLTGALMAMPPSR